MNIQEAKSVIEKWHVYMPWLPKGDTEYCTVQYTHSLNKWKVQFQKMYKGKNYWHWHWHEKMTGIKLLCFENFLSDRYVTFYVFKISGIISF